MADKSAAPTGNIIKQLQAEGARATDPVETADPVVKQAPGVYSDFAGTIHVGNGFSYPWPMGSPFDMEQVREDHRAQAAVQIESMVKRGYATVVE